VHEHPTSVRTRVDTIPKVTARNTGVPRRVAVIGLAAVIALGGCGTTASPSATPAPASPTPTSPISGSPAATPSQPNVVVSTRYGYRLRYPDGWTAAESPGSGGVHPDEPGVDTYRDTQGRTLSVVAEPVAVELNQWTCSIGRHLTTDHGLKAEGVETLTVAGEQARLTRYHLEIKPYLIHYVDVELVHNGRGLALSLESTTKDDEADLLLLRSLLRDLTLTD
jgi:hypothetical protein